MEKYKQNCPHCGKKITPIKINSFTVETMIPSTAARGQYQNAMILGCPERECRILFYDLQK